MYFYFCVISDMTRYH